MGRRLKPSAKKNKKKRAARKASKDRKSSKSGHIETRKLLEAISLYMVPQAVKDHPDGKLVSRKEAEIRKLFEDMERPIQPATVEDHPDADLDAQISRQTDELNRLIKEVNLWMDTATVEDHSDGKRAAQESSHASEECRKLIEEMEEEEEEQLSARRRWIVLKRRVDALRITDDSKPCHGDGGRQEIKDSSNTSRKQSISDDILSDGKDADSETRGPPPDSSRFSELCPYGDYSDSSEDDGDSCEGFDLGEMWPNLDVPFRDPPAGEHYITSGIPLPLGKYE